ncbi:MerR family transcriptional regulator [Pediococcus pentosaceus]|jgi:DNA-binding transcriptional MerR regulator|uniref:MerR family transcriptional regulator n=1 Tax=Pediococcus pentosaceus TaxID=1255 RepID=UPI000AF80FB2|nr:MerR family transcriptional regulator [Pediococcus pentosaceus]
MKISDVSKKFNISIQTLRYYEREGLIPAIHRDSNGVRDYQKDELYWIHYVQTLRNSGVTVASIKKYVGWFKKVQKLVSNVNKSYLNNGKHY